VVAPYVAVNEPLSVEDQHFVDCMVRGERPRTDGENGLAVVEVLEAAELSLCERRPVRIEEVRQRARVAEPVLQGARGLDLGATAFLASAPVVPAQRAGVLGEVR
jgi:hypothetical protein